MERKYIGDKVKFRRDGKNGLKLSILCLLLTAFLLGPLPSTEGWVYADSDTYIKVGLKYGSTTVNRIVIKTDDYFVVGKASNSGFSEDRSLDDADHIVATVEKDVIVLRDEDGALLSSDLGSKSCVMPSDYDDDGTFTLDGVEYRGGLILIPSGSKIKVINYVPLEEYLYGVVHSEMGQGNPIEALKAQAVAARSYVAANTKNHNDDGFDVCATTHCQVYKGVAGEYPSTTKAVDATEGEVLYYDGEPVTAFYSKNSGGYTQNSEDVWSAKEGYLRSVKDKYSPSYPWTTSLTFAALQKKMENAGYDTGTIQSVSITRRADSGAVNELEVVGSKRTVTLKKDAVRTTLGSSDVKSLMFDLVDSINGTGTSTTLSRVYVSDGNTKQEADAWVYAVSQSSGTVEIDAADMYITNGTSSARVNGGTAGATVEKVSSSPLNISGNGFGHGVGMAQDGAIEMAKDGYTYDEILEFYYTDIDIKQY